MDKARPPRRPTRRPRPARRRAGRARRAGAGAGRAHGRPAGRRRRVPAPQQEPRARRRRAEGHPRRRRRPAAARGAGQAHREAQDRAVGDQDRPPQFTTGGSVSNHFDGRGIDIARVDGQIVNAGSTAARELARRSPSCRATCARPRSAPRSRSAPAASSPTATTRTTSTSPSTASRPRLRKCRGPAPAPAAPAAAAARPPRPPAAAAAAADAPAGATQTFKVVEAEDGLEGAQGRHAGVRASVKPKAAAAAAAGRRRAGARRAVDLSDVADAYRATTRPKEQIAAWMATRRRSAGCRPSCRSWPRSSSRG